MNLDKAARQALKYLFSEYKKGPSVRYPINGISKKYGVDPVALSEYLLENFWIRECWIYSGNIVAARITIKGIEKIDPIYVRNKLDVIIDGLANAGRSKPLLEILELKIEEFTIASDLVNELESLGLVKIQNPNHSIVVELTEEGYKHYEKKSGSLLTLMA